MYKDWVFSYFNFVIIKSDFGFLVILILILYKSLVMKRKIIKWLFKYFIIPLNDTNIVKIVRIIL